ncbi:hypothetical protein [Leptolyngbya sp. 7M]|uniref:hypothetical protein n=1 Tax=Leptolyngbya sp. 7M TaxID=2812896 RepID=UPI001B8AA6C4|nr:hypothetical protein [Leptolyngbya sp. 7M]QYO66945.1 hypothetical protein JVX88_09125 [Leptolyngbya sp. 7M]
MILIDSSVLLDLFDEASDWHDWSITALARSADTAPLIINPIIYAEVSINFRTPAEFDAAFPPEDFLRRALPFQAAFTGSRTGLWPALPH